MKYSEYRNKLASLTREERLEFLTAFGYITDILDTASQGHDKSLCYCNYADAVEPCAIAMELIDLSKALNRLEEIALNKLQQELKVNENYYHGV